MQKLTDLETFALTADDHSLAHDVYGRFKQYPGSKHISTEFALAHLSALMRLVQPKTVLELGAGIGTLTYLMLNHTNCPPLLVATETNDFCISQLERNISKSFGQSFILANGDDDLSDYVFSDNQKSNFGDDLAFDLIVMDEDASENMFKYLKHGTYLFIE